VNATARVRAANGFLGAEIELRDDADLQAAPRSRSRATSYASAPTRTPTRPPAARGGSARAFSTARLDSDNVVRILDGANVTGHESILIESVYSRTDNFARAKSRLYAVGGSTRANSTAEVDNKAKVEGHWEAVLVTAQLDVRTLDLNFSNDRSRSPGGAYIGPEDAGAETSRTTSRARSSGNRT
jgi:hypothetical protein